MGLCSSAIVLEADSVAQRVPSIWNIYKKEQLLGTGSFSEVFLAKELSSENQVAIKVILPEFEASSVM